MEEDSECLQILSEVKGLSFYRGIRVRKFWRERHMTMPTIEKALPLGVTAVEGVIPSASIDDTTEQVLVQGLQHVALQVTSFVKDDDILDKGSNGTVNQYPLRLYAQDCPFYLRTGNCKYGLNCKFNHPKLLGRVTNTKVVEAKESKNERERSEQIECKYYLTAGGCKYGKDCRYIHSKEKAETAIPEFNFLGLPIRLGEKECPFYLRTGSCGYGSACRFHHPDPTAVTGFNSHNPPPNGNSVGGLNYIPVNCNGEFDPLHVLRPSKQTAASLSSHVVSEQHVPYSYHSTDALSQKENLNSKCNDYQASFNSVERSLPSLSNADACNQMQTQIEEFPERLGQLECAYFMKTGDCKYRSACRYHHPKSRSSPLTDLTTADLSELHQKHIQFEDFPERPGQQECAYFMKTGECKYRSACRYHHPKNRPQGPGCLLSEKGLPMRPDRKVCWHYEQHGICRYGINCHFDHPENPGLAFQATSASKPLSSNDLPSFGGATDGWAWE